ncbi:MAG: hypothetical protein WC979_06800 [Candidatus Pacearchaeota archaeon]|jgi:hypothetical protein
MTRDITFRLNIPGFSQLKLEGVTGGSEAVDLSRAVEIIGQSHNLAIREPSTVQTVIEDMLTEVKRIGYSGKDYNFLVEVGKYLG